MPFEKGNKLGKGRPGYEIEQAQLKRMRSVLNKDLAIVEKIQGQKIIDLVDAKKLEILGSRIAKIYDKLHATRQETDLTTGGKPIPLFNYVIRDNNSNAQNKEADKKD